MFDKSRILYAMDRARDDIRKDGAVIVEGYMDAIAAHQAGFRNVVASMGTALTEPQVNTIRRLTDRVTMALDQDAAGQQATLRSLESSWRIYPEPRSPGQSRETSVMQRQENPEIRIAAMPPGQDPDEVIQALGGRMEGAGGKCQAAAGICYFGNGRKCGPRRPKRQGRHRRPGLTADLRCGGRAAAGPLFPHAGGETGGASGHPAGQHHQACGARAVSENPPVGPTPGRGAGGHDCFALRAPGP